MGAVTNQVAEVASREQELQEYQQKISDLELELKARNDEIAYLRGVVHSMENSVSWRAGQFYGRFFGSQSIVTRSIRGMINRTINVASVRWAANIEKRTRRELQQILEENKDAKGIIIYPPTVDWNIPLFQRPQQLAIEFAEKGYLFFFSTGSNELDRVEGFRKIQDRCYLTNKYDMLVRELPGFILLLSSTNLVIHLNDVLRLKDKAIIVYEYIDEIHPDISGDVMIKHMIARHDYMKRNADIVIATADNLFNEVKAVRSNDVYLVPNGVDYDHFHIERAKEGMPADMVKSLRNGAPVIGYYGALATWFDYELVRYVADKRPDYEIVLIGWDYDGSIKTQGLEKYSNIHYLGIRKYPILPSYAVWFDVATIPFVLNKITESTSPIKVFEYMALNSPIVTTDLRECRKYKSVLIGKDYDEFLLMLDRALKLRQDPEYVCLLNDDARQNTWESRVDSLIGYIEEKKTGRNR